MWMRTTLLGTLLLMSGCSTLTSLYFFPQTVWIRTPAALGLNYQDVWLVSHDNTQLHAWWLPADGIERVAEDKQQPIVLYLHGNSGNLSSQIPSIDWLPAKGVSVLALDYRGFGVSQGQAILPDALQDVEAAVQWIRARYPNNSLWVIGQSMGAALATNFVAQAGERYEVEKLILDAPFARFPRIARYSMLQTWFGWLFVPFTWLVPNEWDPVDQVVSIKARTLVMHSRDDRVIPYEQGLEVYHALPNDKCWLEVHGRHIQSFDDRRVRQQSLAFLERGVCPRAL